VSVHAYTGPHADRRRSRRSAPGLTWLPWLLALTVVGLQIAYPLVDGRTRTTLVIVTVATFFLASAVHALVWAGAWWLIGFLLVAVGGGLAVEAVGVQTGLPFGDYSYGTGLGRQVLGVPAVIPLAWAMMAYPALLVARRLSRSVLVTPLVAALALASWDLFLDPMMTAEGYWTFADPTPSLAHVPAVPALNYVGWFATSLVMMVLLDRLPRRSSPDGPPALLYLWTYASSILANALFWDRPWVAVYGGLAMGLVALPYAWVLWTGRD